MDLDEVAPTHPARVSRKAHRAPYASPFVHNFSVSCGSGTGTGTGGWGIPMAQVSGIGTGAVDVCTA